MRSTITRRFDGKVYHLAVDGVSKKTALSNAAKIRKQWGKLARVVRMPGGKYNVYSHPGVLTP